MKHKIQIPFLFCLLFSVCLAIAPLGVEAAILYLEPSQGQYQPGDTFLMEIRIDTEGECINTIETNLSFSQDILEGVDFSQGNSILTLWVTPPSINQESGLISFAGGIPGGYCGRLLGDPGRSNLLGRIIFRVREAETKLEHETEAKIEFLDTCQVLLNDGFGTPAKLETKGAILTILPEKLEILKDEWLQELKKDTIPPESFEIEIHQDPSLFEGKYFIIFSTTDKQTGIDHFEVKEGKKDWQRAQSPYLLENQGLQSIIKVKAVDKAGNERIAEYIPPKRPFPYWIIVLVLIGIGVTWWIIRKLKMKSYNLKLKNFYFLIIIFSFLFLVFSFCQAENASLYLSPSAGTYTVGNTFLVQLKVNTGGVAINAADGILIFDPDKLEVKKISKTNSVFALWVQEPVFSNSVGTIDFAGGKPSPGFTGAAGTIITITFKARTSGTANVTFASGSVLADDGKGTNILANMGSGAYKLTTKKITPLPPDEEEYVPPVVPSQAPVAPVVSSLTHPDPEKWYSNNDPEFTWKLSTDATGVSLLLHKNPTGNPGPTSDGLMESKKYEDVEDGIWYFHIKFRNKYGWGKITHRKVLIDTIPPEPFEIEVQREDPTDPQPVLVFETTDELSGVECYEIKIGGGEVFPAEELEIQSYKLPLQAPGTYPIEVIAFDKAGNSFKASTEIEILPIESPFITKFPKSLGVGQNLTLEGTSLPDVKIKIFVQRGEEEPVMNEVEADAQGKWSFVCSRALEKGDYLFWIQAQDTRGALSLLSSKISFWVGLPPFLKFGKIALDYITIMVTLLVLIIGAFVIIFYAWYRISQWRKRLRKETKEVAQSVAKAFRALREEVEEQISMLDKKPGLSKAEKEIRDKLQEALNISEEFIGKEIKDVEKELE